MKEKGEKNIGGKQERNGKKERTENKRNMTKDEKLLNTEATQMEGQMTLRCC